MALASNWLFLGFFSSTLLSVVWNIPLVANGEEINENDSEFLHFTAHNDSMTCTVHDDVVDNPFPQIRGVNLGGWMVLEPWITPSLFYQFLAKGKDDTAVDMYSFCAVLGPEEGNKQLQRHWERWVTKDIVQKLANDYGINSLRLPIGDFQFVPYGPYHGCVDGGLEHIDQLLDWAHEYGLTVLLDVHTAKDSQNGFDNSGQARGMEWLSNDNFQHWPILEASWFGTFERSNNSYLDINYSNIQHSLLVVQTILDRYANHPAVLGVEPLNEPWWFTPLPELKRLFYWEGYLMVQRKAPHWKFVIHDAFQFESWGGFLMGCPGKALDTHIYQAWRNVDSRLGYYADACSSKYPIAKMEESFGPVVVGEWSLATDNCGMCNRTPCAAGQASS